jgi:HK97 family phage prohead protease
MTKPSDILTIVRSYEIDDIEVERADSGDGRMVTMQAVPYGVTIDVPSEGIRERFARGAFAHQMGALHRVQGTYLHQSQGGEVIGRLHTGEDLASGLRVAMRISHTSRGNDTLELVRDRAITQVSIGFRAGRGPKWYRMVDGVTERTRADMFEVALVPQGAYGRNATVVGVRSLDYALRNSDDDAPEVDDLEAQTEDDIEGAEPVEVDTQARAEGMSLDEARNLVRSIPLLPASLIGR